MKIPETKIKRFRIFNADEQSLVTKCDTTEEVYKGLKKLPLDRAHYFVDDVHDDIEVDAEEFLIAWEDGERPLDLQMF